MNKTFLNVAAWIVFVVLLLNLLSKWFGLLDISGATHRAISMILLTLFMAIRMVLYRTHKYGNAGQQNHDEKPVARKPIRYNMQGLLVLVTVVALLFGLTQLWPLLAAASWGAFIWSVCSPYLSLRNTIAESFAWAAWTTVLVDVFQKSSAPVPELGVIFLCIILGATIGGSFALLVQSYIEKE